MDFKKVELINIPQPNVHRIEIAKVKSILAKELQIGDVILSGFNLIHIVKLQEHPGSNRKSILATMDCLSSGANSTIAFTATRVFHRVLNCEVTELDTSGGYRKWYTWSRMRKPILGERTMCGACDGECEAVDQAFIDNFNSEDESVCGHPKKCYDPIHDRFLSYDGCESEQLR